MKVDSTSRGDEPRGPYRFDASRGAAAPEPSSGAAAAGRRSKRRRRRMLFVLLPRRVLLHPPIRHRGAPPNAGLTALECAVAASTAVLARAEALAGQRHDFAFAASGRGLEEMRRRPGKGANAHRLANGKTYFFTVQGKAGYAEAAKAYNRNPSPVTFEISPSRLLAVAGLARTGPNLARLDPALRRLTEPLRCGRHLIPGPLESWRRLPGGRLRLVVAPAWIPGGRYACLAIPLPTRGETVLALYLFVHGADLREDRSPSIRVETLYRRLGIPLTRPAHAQRALDRALGGVNVHLAKLAARGLIDAKTDVPCAFEIVPVAGGQRVRFRALDSIPEPPAAVVAEERAARRASGLAPDEALSDVDLPAYRARQHRQREQARREADHQMMEDVKAKLRAAP